MSPVQEVPHRVRHATDEEKLASSGIVSQMAEEEEKEEEEEREDEGSPERTKVSAIPRGQGVDGRLSHSATSTSEPLWEAAVGRFTFLVSTY